jgi:3-hydroxyisobutyrate dehydrogenase-like beta-hydroxyacid dehydrogenase
MVTVGLVGAGAMGSALGAGWVGGARVVTSTVGRTPRTAALVASAGLTRLETFDDVLAASDLLVSVVPPGAALSAAQGIAEAARRVGARPLVADLNAVSPALVNQIAGVLAAAGLDLVDGAISGPPPAPDSRPVRVYVCGPRAGELAALPSPWLDVVRLSGPLGSASALKMCTASMYKGTKALVMQALMTAESFGVREEFLLDTSQVWPDEVPGWHRDVAVAASKAWRFVDEMHQIAATQRAAGLPAELFEGVAAAYARAATTALGQVAPEDIDPGVSVDEVLAGLAPPGRPPELQ